MSRFCAPSGCPPCAGGLRYLFLPFSSEEIHRRLPARERPQPAGLAAGWGRFGAGSARPAPIHSERVQPKGQSKSPPDRSSGDCFRRRRDSGSFHQYQFSRFDLLPIASLQSVQIDPGGECLPAVVPTIPADYVGAGFPHTVLPASPPFGRPGCRPPNPRSRSRARQSESP